MTWHGQALQDLSKSSKLLTQGPSLLVSTSLLVRMGILGTPSRAQMSKKGHLQPFGKASPAFLAFMLSLHFRRKSCFC